MPTSRFPIAPSSVCNVEFDAGTNYLIAEHLKQQIEEVLLAHGLTIDGTRRGCTRELDKEVIRQLNRQAISTQREKARKGLERHEDQLIGRFANGREVDPLLIRPRLVEVHPNSEEELLFRYARLHWSIPVSAGYGRRLRFLVIDEHTEKLIGLFGLGDPVFNIGPRDRWIGWTDTRTLRLRHVMDAFVLGAVPPYNDLLCGKLVALLATSDEVRTTFRNKYAGRKGLISSESFSGELALLTTTSALGRSSVYNRLKLGTEPAFLSVGYTAGSGEFHFTDGIYRQMLAFAERFCSPTSRHQAWGDGWRNRREVIRSVLGALDLSQDLVYHGIRRELFLAPLASNTRLFLQGDEEHLSFFERPASDVFDWFRDRWLLKRAKSVERYRTFERESLRLWKAKHG